MPAYREKATGDVVVARQVTRPVFVCPGPDPAPLTMWLVMRPGDACRRGLRMEAFERLYEAAEAPATIAEQ